jgi:hypothetical protein
LASDEEFAEFAAGALPRLLRFGHVLTGNPAAAGRAASAIPPPLIFHRTTSVPGRVTEQTRVPEHFGQTEPDRRPCQRKMHKARGYASGLLSEATQRRRGSQPFGKLGVMSDSD